MLGETKEEESWKSGEEKDVLRGLASSKLFLKEKSVREWSQEVREKRRGEEEVVREMGSEGRRNDSSKESIFRK